MGQERRPALRQAARAAQEVIGGQEEDLGGEAESAFFEKTTTNGGEVQGYPSALRPRFCVLITEILLSLPDSAWKFGRMGIADQQQWQKTTKDGFRAGDSPCINAEAAFSPGTLPRCET